MILLLLLLLFRSVGVAAGTNSLFPPNSAICICFHQPKFFHIFFCRILPPFSRSISFSLFYNHFHDRASNVVFAPSRYVAQSSHLRFPAFLRQLLNSEIFLLSSFRILSRVVTPFINYNILISAVLIFSSNTLVRGTVSIPYNTAGLTTDLFSFFFQFCSYFLVANYTIHFSLILPTNLYSL